MKDRNVLAIVSFVLAMIALLLAFFLPVKYLEIGCVLIAIASIAGIVLGFIARKQIKSSNQKGKRLSLAGIIIGFLTIFLTLYTVIVISALDNIEFADMSICPVESYVGDCVDNNDGTSTCMYMNELEVTCSTDVLSESQFKE